MAITASGLYIPTWKKPFDGNDLVIDWVNDTCKGALFNNSITPNFSTDTAYVASPYTSNEITGTNYSAGGGTLASKTVSESPTGTLMFDAADLAWASATFSGARGLLIWDDTLTGDLVLALLNFGADYGVTAGTFTVQFASGGIFTYDITP